jgi:hypothetical protein
LGQIHGGFTGLVRVRHQGSQDIDHGVNDAAIPGVIDLLDILELIVNSLNDRALAQQEFIGQGHEFIAHVLADFSDQTQAPRQ